MIPKVVIFSAPSGSGKTTLVRYALDNFPELHFSISCTTRAPRGTEIHGKDYYFLSPADFRSRIAKGDFIEYEEVYEDKFYGTLKSEIDRIAALGGTVIFDVDVQGGITLKNYFGTSALAIFIQPPSLEELQKRLLGRGTDSAAIIEERLAKAAEELSYAPQFDIILTNDDIHTAKEELTTILTNFGLNSLPSK